MGLERTGNQDLNDYDGPLLEIRGLTTLFKTREGPVRAVDGVDLRVRRGETVGLVGESGCGKSMLAHSLLRLVPVPGQITSGEIIWKGQNILLFFYAQIRRVRGRELALIFQEPSAALNPVLSIGTQVTEPLRVHLGLSRRKAKEKAVGGGLKRSKARNLLERLIAFEKETLRFMDDPKIPFTNNQGENDIRMTKVQQKISGCFRSKKGADMFCRIRSYLSTCRKHGLRASAALRLLFEGKLPDFFSEL